MDWSFTLFVLIVAVVAALGFSLSLVGYLTLMPASLAHGRKWLYWVILIPAGLLLIPLFAGTLLNYSGFSIQLTKILLWLGIPALFIHLGALLYFVSSHWAGCRKPGQQLGAGIALLFFAGILLYGAGPLFASRLLESLKNTQFHHDQGGQRG